MTGDVDPNLLRGALYPCPRCGGHDFHYMSGHMPPRGVPLCQPKEERVTPEILALLFHENYEELAPQFGYTTREETKEFDFDSPNGKLMIATAGEVLKLLRDYGVEI